MQENLKQKLKILTEGYGSETNVKSLRNKCVIAIVAVYLIIQVPIWKVPQLSTYFNCIRIAFVLNIFCMYFYRKRNNSEKNRRIKIFLYFFSLIGLLAMILPILFLFWIIDFLADTSNKNFSIKMNFECFLWEAMLHMQLCICLISETINHSEEVFYLLITYSMLFLFDKILCNHFIRKKFILGKNKFYQRYKYAQEMDVISEYIFLFVTTISILYSNTKDSYVFIPILLWYSLKQIRKFRDEKKNSSIVKKYLLEILQVLEEIHDVYLESWNDEKIRIEEYLGKRSRSEGYLKFFERRKRMNLLSRSKVQKALLAIISLSSMEYDILHDKEKLKEDVENTMDSIVRCI